MADAIALLAVLGMALGFGASREFTNDNRRDAALLAGSGAAITLGGAALWLA